MIKNTLLYSILFSIITPVTQFLTASDLLHKENKEQFSISVAYKIAANLVKTIEENDINGYFKIVKELPQDQFCTIMCIVNERKDTPLMTALFHKSIAIASALLTRIYSLAPDVWSTILCKVNQDGVNALILAARTGNAAITEQILRMIPKDQLRRMINFTNTFLPYQSAFVEAVKSGSLQTLNVLLDQLPTLLELETHVYEVARENDIKNIIKQNEKHGIESKEINVRIIKVSDQYLMSMLQEKCLPLAKDLGLKSMQAALEEAIQKAKDWCKENNKEW